MVVVMMVMSPISGQLTGKMGPRRLITFGMLITGAGTLLMLLTGVSASYWMILPSFIVMGFGMSFIWAPMTTAVLNSVESEKSGVASAVNGALREIGTAFGVALLGTLASRAYKDSFNSSNQIEGVRAQADGPLQGIVAEIGKNMSFAGHVIEDTGIFDPTKLPSLTPGVVSTLREVSSTAFMAGMDRAIYFSGIGLIIVAVLSYFLIQDSVVESAQPETAAVPERERERELAANPAD
jgi:MFS family permease